VTGRLRRSARVALAGAGALWPGLALPTAARAAEPRILYMLECQGCHLPDGRGVPGGVPDLRGRLGRFVTVPGGREYLVRVPGSAQSSLDDAELAAVLDWMIREFGPPEVAARLVPFSAEEVARHRRRPLTDVGAARRELLHRIEAASD